MNHGVPWIKVSAIGLVLLVVVIVVSLIFTSQNDRFEREPTTMANQAKPTKGIPPIPTATRQPTVSIPRAATPSEAPTKPALAAGAQTIYSVDALGMPIASGTVILASTQIPLLDGCAALPNIPSGTYTVTARAKGYSAVTRTISLPLPAPLTIVLEYQFDFTANVLRSSMVKQPVEGAKVTLWKIAPIQRPVRDTTALHYVFNFPYMGHCWKLKRTPAGIRIGASDHERRMTSKPGRDPLLPGDVIVGLSGSMWRAKTSPRYVPISGIQPYRGNVSRPLRLWDVLASISAKPPYPSGAPNDFFEVVDQGIHYYALTTIDAVTNKSVQTRTTDRSGQAVFTNLPPAIYAVQAIFQRQRSDLVLCHPARQGAELYMHKGSEVMVRVHQTLPKELNNQNSLNSPKWRKNIRK